jgi:hypothetical protein
MTDRHGAISAKAAGGFDREAFEAPERCVLP